MKREVGLLHNLFANFLESTSANNYENRLKCWNGWKVISEDNMGHFYRDTLYLGQCRRRVGCHVATGRPSEPQIENSWLTILKVSKIHEFNQIFEIL